MKTVAAPIYFGLLQSTETTILTDKKKEKESKPLKGFLAGGQMWVGLGIMTTVAAPIFGLLIPTPITKKEKKANLEEDLLAGGTEDLWLP